MSRVEDLSPEEHQWLARDEQRWRIAHDIVRGEPALDLSGVYRVLRNLEKTPGERLRDALQHGRLFRLHTR